MFPQQDQLHVQNYGISQGCVPCHTCLFNFSNLTANESTGISNRIVFLISLQTETNTEKRFLLVKYPSCSPEDQQLLLLQ